MVFSLPGTKVQRNEKAWNHIFNDMQSPLTQISRSQYFQRQLNYSTTVQDSLSYSCSDSVRSGEWSGFCSASDINKLDKFLNRCKRLNCCSQTTPCITEQFDTADESLFQTVTSDSHHVLHHLLPVPAIKKQDTNLGLELTVSP